MPARTRVGDLKALLCMPGVGGLDCLEDTAWEGPCTGGRCQQNLCEGRTPDELELRGSQVAAAGNPWGYMPARTWLAQRAPSFTASHGPRPLPPHLPHLGCPRACKQPRQRGLPDLHRHRAAWVLEHPQGVVAVRQVH